MTRLILVSLLASAISAQALEIHAVSKGGEMPTLVGPDATLQIVVSEGQRDLTRDVGFTLEPAGIAMAPGDPQLENLIRNFLWAFEGSGLLEQLRAKWLEDGSWIAALP